MKRLLLIPLLFLCSCTFDLKGNTQIGVNNTEFTPISSNNETTSIKVEYTRYDVGLNKDGYSYWFFIDYQKGGALIIARTNSDYKYVEHKSFPFGKYEYIYTYTKYGGEESVYDYGEYAVWVKKGI